MPKVVNIFLRSLGVMVEWLLILCIAFAFLIRTSAFQTYIAHLAADYYAKVWNTKVEIGKVDITFFSRVYIEDVLIQDHHQRNMIVAPNIELTLDGIGLEHAEINELTLNNAEVWFCKERENGEMNFQFIADYFASEDTTQSNFTTTLKTLRLKDARIKYDDFRVRAKAKGFDPSHIAFNNVCLSLQGLKNKGPATEFNLTDFSMKEKSGLNIHRISGLFSMDEKSLSINKFHCAFNNSQINAEEIGYHYLLPKDMEDFNNRVNIKAVFGESTIQLADLSLVSPDLSGMKGPLSFRGTVENVVNHLFLRDFEVRVQKNSSIRGDFELPSFENLTKFKIKENLKYAAFDFQELKTLKLPKGKNLPLDDALVRLGKVQVRQLVAEVTPNTLRLQPFTVHTQQGSISLKSSVKIGFQQDDIVVKNENPDKTVLEMSGLKLGSILNDPAIGQVDGTVSLNELQVNGKEILLNGGKGMISSLQFHGHNYHGLTLESLEIENNQASAQVSLDDQSAALNLKGTFSLEGKPTMKVEANILRFDGRDLGFPEIAEVKCKGGLSLDTDGSSWQKVHGAFHLNDFNLEKSGKKLDCSQLDLDFDVDGASYDVQLKGDLMQGALAGSLDINALPDELASIASKVIPLGAVLTKPKEGKISNKFKLFLQSERLDQVADLLNLGVVVGRKTTLKMDFDSQKEFLNLDLHTDQLGTKEAISGFQMSTNAVDIKQQISEGKLSLNLKLGDFVLVDESTKQTQRLRNLSFESIGTNALLRNVFAWKEGDSSELKLNFDLTLGKKKEPLITLDSSYFVFAGNRWDIERNGKVSILAGNNIGVKDFQIKRRYKNQCLIANGVLSDKLKDELSMNLVNIDLEELSKSFDLDVSLSGKLSGALGIKQPFKNLIFTSDVDVSSCFVNGEELGDISMLAGYDDKLASVILKGDLCYRGNSSLGFNGIYNIRKQKDNLSINVFFNQMDIGFTNGFLDKDVINDIHGKINGSLAVTGTPSYPVVKGEVSIVKANAFVALLGCRYSLNGKIKSDVSSFVFDRIPMCDEDGNIAYVTGAINHSNFSRINYDVGLNFEEPSGANKSPLLVKKSEKFMVLNTKYDPSEAYYGKAYCSGSANISGYGSSMDVSVNLKSQKGTQVIFPMYGHSELKENSIIRFASKDKPVELTDNDIDYTGVNLDIAFNVTPDAEIKIVFNQQTQDEIKAKTQGRLDLNLDAFNQMSLKGGLKILPGSLYNFTMGPARKPFEILSGSIDWSGDVYHADLNVQTSYAIRNANMLDLTPGQNDPSLLRQTTLCLLKLTGDLEVPKIGFELASPNAPETGRALLNRVNADPDELNRQFFSLMIFGKFQPLHGALSANESATFDLVESQINAALSQLSKDYQIKMDIGASNISTSVQKSFLNNRLNISGSFGVENTNAKNSPTGGLMGDVAVEYLVNENGTFRISAFNRSNGNTVKENAGPFTQGLGLSYHEEFNNRRDFLFMQSFFDVFRSKNNKVVKFSRKKKQTKIPPLEKEVPKKQDENE